MAAQQAPKETLRRSAVSPRLDKYVNDFAVLVYRPPELMLLAIDFNENFVDEKHAAEPNVFVFQR